MSVATPQVDGAIREMVRDWQETGGLTDEEAVFALAMQLFHFTRAGLLMREVGCDWDGLTEDEVGEAVTSILYVLGGGDTDAGREAAELLVLRYVTWLNVMPYRDYLRTPEWQVVRYFALTRAGRRCQVCNSSHRLEVHHRTYERRGIESLADVTVLCRTHHALFHGKQP